MAQAPAAIVKIPTNRWRAEPQGPGSRGRRDGRRRPLVQAGASSRAVTDARPPGGAARSSSWYVALPSTRPAPRVAGGVRCGTRPGSGSSARLHPVTDFWLAGARYGTVVIVGREKVHVTLDRMTGLSAHCARWRTCERHRPRRAVHRGGSRLGRRGVRGRDQLLAHLPAGGGLIVAGSVILFQAGCAPAVARVAGRDSGRGRHGLRANVEWASATAGAQPRSPEARRASSIIARPRRRTGQRARRTISSSSPVGSSPNYRSASSRPRGARGGSSSFRSPQSAQERPGTAVVLDMLR